MDCVRVCALSASCSTWLDHSADKHTAGSPRIFSLACVRLVCVVRRGHDFTSERNEDFYQISVEVKGMGTLQKSLDDYVKVRKQLPCPVGCSSSCVAGCRPGHPALAVAVLAAWASSAFARHTNTPVGLRCGRISCSCAARRRRQPPTLDLCLLSCCNCW